MQNFKSLCTGKLVNKKSKSNYSRPIDYENHCTQILRNSKLSASTRNPAEDAILKMN